MAVEVKSAGCEVYISGAEDLTKLGWIWPPKP